MCRNHIKRVIKVIKKTFYAFLTAPDYSYLNFIGEIAVLNQLLKSKDFALEAVESPLLNGNKADFLLLNIPKKRKDLLEVVNIRINKPISEDLNEFNKFLNKRVEDKIDKKSKQDKKLIFILAPVIWAEGKELQQISKHFRNGAKIDHPLALEPLAYLMFYSDSGIAKPIFGSISTVFDPKFFQS